MINNTTTSMVDQLTVDQPTVDQPTVDQLTVDQLTVDQRTDNALMDNALTVDELKANAKARRKQQLKRMWQRNRVREMRPVYWRRLVEVGVPVEVADVIAKAIAQYDASRQLPTLVQQHLIREYCRFVCRAELWRSPLLTKQAV